MRRFSRGVIGALVFINALCFMHACSRQPLKKDQKSAAEGPAMKQSAAVVERTIVSEPNRPACLTGPPHMSEPPPGVMVWRDEVRLFKGQLLKDIQQTGLTQEKAVRLALINNPDLFAFYENIELGYAELLEAGLRQNPVVSASVRFPDEPGYEVNKLFDTSINFLDFFLIPFRQRAAEAEIFVIEAQVSQSVLNLVKDVQINWLMMKTLELELDQEKKRVALKELAAEFAGLQKRAGNISSLNARKREIQFEEAVEKLKSLSAVLEMAREKMNRSLGLFANETCWQLSGDVDWRKEALIPDLPIMERAAVENRPDIEAIRREIYAIAQKAKLREPWTYTNLKVGISAEREPEGFTVAGPAIELETPIFNYGQGEMKKYGALISQAQKKLVGKAVQACSEVREFLKTSSIYRSQIEDLETKILPDFQKQVADAQTHYNVMTLGVYDLFDLKEDEITATIEHIQALKHYLQAKIELFHAVGGTFETLRGKG